MSADGSTLYVTDNLGGTVIPINTATDRAEPAQTLTQGVDFYVPSPTTSGAIVGVDTSPGQPGVIYFYNPSTGTGSPVAGRLESCRRTPSTARTERPPGSSSRASNSQPGRADPGRRGNAQARHPDQARGWRRTRTRSPRTARPLVIGNGVEQHASRSSASSTRAVVATVAVGVTPDRAGRRRDRDDRLGGVRTGPQAGAGQSAHQQGRDAP